MVRYSYKKAAMSCLAIGKCTVFKPGEHVYLQDVLIFSRIVKVRKHGDVQSYWVPFKAID